MRSPDHTFSEKFHTLCNLPTLHFQADHKHVGMIQISYTMCIMKSLHVTETSLWRFRELCHFFQEVWIEKTSRANLHFNWRSHKPFQLKIKSYANQRATFTKQVIIIRESLHL